MVWQGDLTKKKKSGGKKKAYRTKRSREAGRHPVETTLGDVEKKIVKGHSAIRKVKLASDNMVNVSDPSTGASEHLQIIAVVRNPANVDYNRRRVLTKGAIIRTEKGLAKIVSRPGQDGILNAVVYTEQP